LILYCVDIITYSTLFIDMMSDNLAKFLMIFWQAWLV